MPRPLVYIFPTSIKFKTDYTKFIEDQIEKGYSEKVLNSNVQPGKLWYLPHHAVYHPKKPDKIRVVFDCSAEYGGASLNSKLIPSPDLTNSLVGVLLRFRRGKVAFVGDLEGMFLQVRVPEEDRNLLRFLWWEGGDTSRAPEEYRMTVHLFGATSSPGCANYALRRTADDHGKGGLNKAALTIKRNFYMDDCCASVDSEDEAIALISDLQKLCQKGGFHFHKLLSNSSQVVKAIPIEERASGLKDFDKNGILPVERALGITWCVESDAFQFRVTVSSKPFTRRGILSCVCSVYDPLGFLAPFVVLGKLILQDICRENRASSNYKDWDEELSLEIKTRWERWLHELKFLVTNDIKLKRCYLPQDADKIDIAELHHFADASSYAYGHVTYLRIVTKDNKVYCSFVFGKARVKPLKDITIPRLELTAAVSVAKMSEVIRREIDLPVKSYFWIDSKVVLSYIYNVTKRFHVL